MALPIAVQVYSVRNDAKADLRGTLEKIKKMGYDGVEFAGLYKIAPADIAQMCKELELVPISAHVPYTEMMGAPKAVLAQYAEIGCKFVAIPSLGSIYRPGGKGWEETVENIKMLGKVAKSYGIQLLYHNHDFEFAKLNGKYALDEMYDTIPADLLQTELDVCWVNIGGEDPAAYVRKYTGRSPLVHLKDFFGTKSENMYELIGVQSTAVQRPTDFELRPVGSGVQDVPSILKASEDAGASWIVVEQDDPSMGLTPMECIEKSINYLKSIGY